MHDNNMVVPQINYCILVLPLRSCLYISKNVLSSKEWQFKMYLCSLKVKSRPLCHWMLNLIVIVIFSRILLFLGNDRHASTNMIHIYIFFFSFSELK